jgi:oxygen-independent coproporphyrinogen-3 oxidase
LVKGTERSLVAAEERLAEDHARPAPSAQHPAPSTQDHLPGVYVHVPFCRTKCTYCSFLSGDYDEAIAGRYLAALTREIEVVGGLDGRPRVDTVYFGGGTPSLLPAHELVALLGSVRAAFEVAPSAEITVEMNPGTLTPEKLDAYRAAGVNRASVGVQSFDDAELRSIGRVHDAADARAAVATLRAAGFDNVSLDLIAGLPRQAPEVWRRSVESALELEPDHLSLYLLELHPGTRLTRDVEAGRVERPDDDLAAEAYYWMIDRLEAAGFVHYEISNFARRLPGGGDRRSRHNEKYWLDVPFYGFGGSAHGYTGRERLAHVRSIKGYVDAVERDPAAAAERTPLHPSERAAEAIFTGLRRLEGVDLRAFRERYGVSILDDYRAGLEPLLEAGLVAVTGDRLHLTRRGLALSNEVFLAFV